MPYFRNISWNISGQKNFTKFDSNTTVLLTVLLLNYSFMLKSVFSFYHTSGLLDWKLLSLNYCWCLVTIMNNMDDWKLKAQVVVELQKERNKLVSSYLWFILLLQFGLYFVPGLQRTGSAWKYKSQYNINSKWDTCRTVCAIALHCKTNTNPDPDSNRYSRRCPDPNARIQKFIHYMATTPQWVVFAE